MTRFTDGIAAFEVTADSVKPLYASDNICRFFGFTEKEWLQIMKKGTSIKTFVERSQTPYEEFQTLLQNGEANASRFRSEIKNQKNCWLF